MKTKNFTTQTIEKGITVIPTVIVTIINHWDGQKSIKRAYLNYLILGFNWDQEQSYNFIANNYPHLLKSAEEYASQEAELIYHQ